MALIKYGAGVIQMSGSIAGNTFARNHFGNYCRAKTKPINPNTSQQSIARACLAFLTTRWSQLLDGDQREAWNMYGSNVAMKNKLGEVVFLTGFNHYIRSNTLLKLRGETLVDEGPGIFELPAKDPTIRVTIEVHEHRTNLYFDASMDWVSETGAWLFILEGMPQNPQRNYFGGPYLGIKDKHGDSEVQIESPEHFTHLHVLSAGQKVWYQFRIQRADGRISEPFYANAIVQTGPIPPEE